MSWPLVNLESVAHINPRLPKGTDESQVVTFLKMASVSEGGELLEQEKRILSETKKGFTYFEKDDVLLAKITPCFENGKAALLDDLETQLGFGSTEFHVLRAVEGKLDSKYLFHLVWNEEFRFLGKHAMKGAAGQQRISTDFLKNLKIPLPPLETQKQIAAVLEKADQLRKDCQQMEQELNNLAQSVFIDMFGDPVTNPKGWDKRPLLELVADKDDIKCGPFGTQLGKSEFTTEGVPLWGIKHVNSGFEKPTVEYVSHEKALDLKAYSIVGGDIVMTRKGNVGNCYIYPDNLQSGIMHSDLLRIRPCNSTVSASFLQKQFMYSKDVEGQLKLISQGAIMAGINVTKLKSLMLLSPPLEEQKEYEKFLSEVETNKITSAHKLSESNNMFNALMQKAFKGELNL
ncbi:restriction endonuclease subunit S [Vibrio atlanticus]|uniref:restriction endonuclease subunit S n=1 Tax=Vibrio atlanticus TaxID=693153 RepID=UPI00354DCBFB